MIASERQLYILQQLDEKGIVYLKDTSNELGASICTIRRDFEKLEADGQCKRVRGGAVKIQGRNRSITEMSDIFTEERMNLNIEQKERICKKIADLISDGDCVFIDGGSTFINICDYLQGKNVSIVTHNQLIQSKVGSTISLNVLGGNYEPYYRMYLGTITTNNLAAFHFDKAFIGCSGIGIDDKGIYIGDVVTAQVKEMALKLSKKCYLAADSSKIGIYGFYRCSSLDQMDGIITDNQNDSIDILDTKAEIILA